MNLQPLYNVKERLRASAIAGVGLIDEDFRLKRAVQEMEPLAAAGAVFAKLQARLDALFSAPPEQRAGALLNALALTDAILYTQGRTGIEGDLTPLAPECGKYLPLSYEQIHPLIEALTTTGSGRFQLVQRTNEEHPEYFSDYRILPKVIDGLGDRYSELGELCVDILSAQGERIVPILKEGFDPVGGRAMQLRVKVIADVAEESEWILSQLPAAKKDVRAALLLALGKSAENIPILLEFSKKERGKNREAVLSALGSQECVTPELRAFWEDEIKATSRSTVFLKFLRYNNSEWVSDLVAEYLRECLERILGQPTIDDAEQSRDLRMWIYQVRGRVSPAMNALWLWIDEHFDALERVEDRSGKYGWERIGKIGTELMQNLFYTLCARREISELYMHLYRTHQDSPRYVSHGLIASLLTKDAAEVYEEFSPMLLTQKPLLDYENKRQFHDAVLSALYSSVVWSREKKTHCIHQGDMIQPCRQPLDRRWFDRIVNCLGNDKELPLTFANWGDTYSGKERIAGIDYMIVAITNPDDAEMSEKIASYLRRRMIETGQWSGYSFGLLHIGKRPCGALKQCFAKERRPPDSYPLWEMLDTVSQRLPASEVAAMIEEILEADWLLPIDEKSLPQGKIKSGVYPFWSDRTAVRNALKDAAEWLEKGQPFLTWSEWMDV